MKRQPTKRTISIVHGVVDYTISGLLLVGPWLFGVSHDAVETDVMVGAGLLMLVYTLCTKFQVGFFRKMSMALHFECDFVLGIVLMLVPYALGFDTWWPYLVVGAVEIVRAIAMALMLGILKVPTHRNRARTTN